MLAGSSSGSCGTSSPQNALARMDSSRWSINGYLCALAHVRREARRRHGDRGGGVAVDARDGAIETSTSGDRYHQGFGDKAFRAFESPRIETGSFRLDDPQRHRFSAFLAWRALEPVRKHCLSPIRSCCRVSRPMNNGSALRKSCVRKVTDFWKVTGVCAAITKEFF
jgi:hypothetical protein